jgi:hypothetical protein
MKAMNNSFGNQLWISFRDSLCKVWSFICTLSAKVIGILLVILVVVIAILLVSLGFKELQIGGILSKLLGKKDSVLKVLDIVNSVDPDRIDPKGNIIPIGKPDSSGNTQAVVVPIQEPGLFSDPKKVVITPPGEDKPVEIILPDGVTSKDVDQVIIVKPNVIVVSVHDNSGISSSDIDRLLSKYK